MLKTARSVVFIDANVSDVQHLVNGVLPDVDVKVLASDVDGVAQITDYLRANAADTVHIVSHGAPGILFLGNTQLNLTNLEGHAQALKSWFSGQNSKSTLLLYGCNVAAGDAGEEFIHKLQDLTSANIAASRQVIGQGYWSLEVSPTHTTALAPFSATVLATWAGKLAPVINNLSNSSYTEQGPAFILDNDITFSGGTNYKNGYVEFSLSTATSSDFLTLATNGSPATGNGQISIIGNAVYVGNGSAASVIGNVDSTFDGQNGQKLRINFSAGFENGNFNLGTAGSTTITGWTGVDQRVEFGTDTIAGSPTPIDTTFPVNNSDQGQNTPSNPGTFSTVLSGTQNDGSGNSVQLRSSGIRTQSGFDIVRGPSIYSNSTVQLSVGDQVSFEWQAQGGGDAYDVYGYIVEVNTGNIVTILNETGASDTASTTWATETVNITQAGEYRFVFVAGTFDFTGGRIAGAQLFIDDVVVTQATPPVNPNDSMLSAIAQKVQYNNTSDAPELSKTLTVSAKNNLGETASSMATITITPVNDPTTGTVTFTGTPTQGQTLTAANTLADLDGLGTISYQWQESTNGTIWTNITGATAATFALTQTQVNKVVRVNASFTDGGGTLETKASTATTAVASVNAPATGTVTFTGTPTQGSTLTAANTLADLDGLGTISYQWQESTNGTTWTNITGATAATFALTQTQVNKVVRVNASFTDGGGTLETKASTATTAVANVNDPATGTVTFTGTPTQGQTLTAANTLADLDGLGTISYQWQESTNGTTWINITGATAATFALTQTQVNKVVRVNASFTDGSSTLETKASTATTAVANVNDPATGTVTIDGTITQGQILTANTSTLVDLDGLGTFSYQWQQSTNGITWSNIDGATGVDFSPRNGQVSQFLQVAVSYVDGQGTSESLTSAPTSESVEKFGATSDFNGDGSVDIFWRHQNVGESVFWLMDNIDFAGGDVLSPVISDVNWDIKALGDLNGDGKADLVWQNKATNQAAVWLMDGVTLDFGALLPNDAASGWKVVESDDFNNNGKDDLLWRNANTGELAVWFMDGTDFVSGEFITLNAGLDWEVGAVGDFTKDGKVDIFWENRITGANAFWEMDGTNFVNARMTTSAETIWQAKGSADFNQDGNLDLLWHNPSTGENALWLMDGTDFVAGVTTLPTTEVSWNPVV